MSAVLGARLSVLGLGFSLVAFGPLGGQPIPDDRLFVAGDAWLLGAFAAGTVAMFPLDRTAIARIRDSTLLRNRRVETAARIAGFLGSPGPFLIGGAMFGVGRVAGEPRLVQLAAHGAIAITAGALTTGFLKATLGRARPWVTADTNPRDFQLLRGFTADRYQAFPSGHTTIAFAAASSVTAELNGWYPDWRWVTGPLLYGGATLVGVSRMYEDRHWPSDVVLGAAIGTVAGLKAVRFARTASGRRLDRRLIGRDAPALRVGYAVRW